MGKLSELLRQLFQSGVESAASGFRMDIAYRMILLGAIVSVVGVFFVVIQGAIGTLNFFTNDWLDIAMSWFVPYQTPICLAALATARIARAVLDYHLMLIYGGMSAGSSPGSKGTLGGGP
ncbi:hypothetical protein [Aliamphritea ceti]|uniref:hypothetical protein n=1 Tax=Aliamphritea ceti TaxID=1524258 RepID=UPI0021C3754E|nr:hypothetical protein [Aliamphritea ceti]